MPGLRKVSLNVVGKIEPDNTITLNFILTGLNNQREADEYVAAIAPKLRHTIVRLLKKRGSIIQQNNGGKV